MKFGVFHSLQNVGHKRDYSDLLNETREMAEYCDSAGFDSFWLGEHHFSIWERELMGNPILVSADLAARTSRIRIGLAAVIATFWHPLRLAEDLATLDHLCNGRLEIGFGRGNYGLEALNLNSLADPNKPEENLAVFAETVNVVKAAFTNDRFSFKGKKYAFPTPGFFTDIAHKVTDPRYIDQTTGEMIKISVHPRPKQKPTPPLWQVVDSPSSIEWAARNDLGVIMWRPTVQSMRARFELYRKAASETAGEPVALGARTGILRDTFVAESSEEARRIAGGAVMGNLNFSNWRGPRIYLNPGETLDAEQEASLKKELTYDFVNERSLLFGSPDDVVQRLREMRDVTNIEHVILKVNWVGFDHQHTMRSLRMFGEHVLPRIREDEAKMHVGAPRPVERAAVNA